MVDIQINNKYKIKSNSDQYIVYQKQTANKNSETDCYRPIAYISDINYLCQYLADKLTKESEARTLKDLANEYKRNAQEIKELLKMN